MSSFPTDPNDKSPTPRGTLPLGGPVTEPPPVKEYSPTTENAPITERMHSAEREQVATADTFIADSAAYLGGRTPSRPSAPGEPATLESSEQAQGRDPGMLTREHEGRYRVVDEIGRGGIGRVLLALDEHMGREVAIKELLPQFLDSGSSDPITNRSQSELRFLTEARITGNLEHPGIVPVYELGQRSDGTVYYVMKLVRGQTLQSALKNQDLRGRLNLVPRYIEVCNAIAFAHSHGVIHRDLKPDNIMLGEFGETLVLDWGLAKIKDQRDLRGSEIAGFINRLRENSISETAMGVPMGTPQYMPPEQALGDVANIDEASDVYTLGAILYEILTGRPPHQEKTPMQTILAVLDKPIIVPQTVEPECPPELAAIAMRALSMDKAQRYASAAELVEEVERFQQGRLVRTYRYSTWELARRWILRHRKLMLLGLLILVAVGGSWWYRGYADARRSARKEQQRIEAVLNRVDKIVEEVRRGSKGERWIDIYTFKLIALKERMVEQKLMDLLQDPSIDVRRLAARALGGMNSGRSVRPLMARLTDHSETDESVLIEIINALGIIGDTRANDVILSTRRRFGQYSAVWNQTSLAYKMIPQGTPVAGKSADDFHQLGVSLENKEKYEEARAAYLQALERDPDYYKTHNNLGNLYKRQRMYDRADFHLTRAVELDSGSSSALNNRGLLYREMDQYEKALIDFNKALQLKANYPSALNNRGTLYIQMGNYKAALSDFEKAVALQPKNVRYQNNVGEIAMYNNDFSGAEAAFRKAIAIDPGYHQARMSLVRLKFIQKNYADALIETNLVLDLDPNYFSALAWKIRLLLTENRRSDAEVVLQHLKTIPKIENYGVEIYEAINWHFYLGDLEKASAILTEVLAKELPVEPRKEYFLLYIPIRIQLGDRESWKKELQRLVALGGTSWYDGILRMIAGEVSREEVRLKAINKLRLLSYYMATGVLSEMEGRVEEAVDAYRRAVDCVHIEQYDWMIAYDGVRRFEGVGNRITGAMLTPLKLVGLTPPGPRTGPMNPAPAPRPAPTPVDMGGMNP